MGENYKLVILSNADDSFLAESVPRLGADFHAVYTAEVDTKGALLNPLSVGVDAMPEDCVHVSWHSCSTMYSNAPYRGL